MKIAENRKFQKRKRSARAGGKKAKHFLGYGPEAPRLARAVRARARARALSIGERYGEWRLQIMNLLEKFNKIFDMSKKGSVFTLYKW